MLEIQPYKTEIVEKVISDSSHEHAIGNNSIKTILIFPAPLEERFKWLWDLQSDFEAEVSVETIALAYEKIDELVQKKAMVKLDELIETLIHWNLSYELKSGMLRYTFSIKHQIPHWDEALQDLILKMKKRDMDIEGILIGLT